MIFRRETSAACSARGGSHDVAQHAVDAKAHDRARLVGLDVDVGRALAQRLRQQRVDHADDRRVVAASSRSSTARQVLHQPREIDLAREIVRRAARRSAAAAL